MRCMNETKSNVFFRWAQGEVPESQNLRFGEWLYRLWGPCFISCMHITSTITPQAPNAKIVMSGGSQEVRGLRTVRGKFVLENGTKLERGDVAGTVPGSCWGSGNQFWKESSGDWWRMGMDRHQQQRRGNILCPLHFPKWTEENFNPGKVEVSKTTAGIQNPGWTSLRVGEGLQWLESNAVMLLELRRSSRCQLMISRYDPGDSSKITLGVAHVLSTESGQL